MTAGLQSVAIWSPKGGVGKSVLAVSLALKMAEQRRTVLIDGNADNPDLVSLLQCPGQPNVSGWVEPDDPQDLERLLVRHSGRLWVLPGPSRYVDESALSGPVMESVLETCMKADFTAIADLGSALRDSTLAALERVDLVLIPVTLDLLSLAPLRRLGRELDLLRLPRAKFRVVVNRLTNTREITLDDVHSFCDFPVLGTIPSARDLAAAVIRGEVVAALAGDSQVGRAVAKLAEPLMGVSEAVPAGRRRSLVGLLSGRGRAD